MRLTISVDCDPLSSYPEGRMTAGCALIASLAEEVRSTAYAAALMSEHGTFPSRDPVTLAVQGQVTTSAGQVLFRGDLDGREVRVRRLSPHDLVVEGSRPAYSPSEGDAAWEATGDGDAMWAYELCIRSLLGDI